MKIVTILGARPQFIKAAPVSVALKQTGHCEYTIHTGQHYDFQMSGIFFKELALTEPNVNLGIGSGSHGLQTGRMLIGIEEQLLVQRPDGVLVYGDTNSTLAGALAACKLGLKLAHVEAGLRSYNREMPEEHNRVLTDHCSDLLLCPTETAVQNLKREGIISGVHLVGDPMHDALVRYAAISRARSTIVEDLGLRRKTFILATVHRPANTDDPAKLQQILRALAAAPEPVVLPAHPRTVARMSEYGLDVSCFSNLRLLPPVGYVEMLALETQASVIVTDSGGVQKEAFWLGVPCVTLREETEWTETVQSGLNALVGTDTDSILAGIRTMRCATGISGQVERPESAMRIVLELADSFKPQSC